MKQLLPMRQKKCDKLPHQKRKAMKDQLNRMKNEPIAINDEHEFSHLFLQEFYKKQPSCNISNHDPSAILNILSKAFFIDEIIRNQAGKVRDEVGNQWAHASG